MLLITDIRRHEPGTEGVSAASAEAWHARSEPSARQFGLCYPGWLTAQLLADESADLAPAEFNCRRGQHASVSECGVQRGRPDSDDVGTARCLRTSSSGVALAVRNCDLAEIMVPQNLLGIGPAWPWGRSAEAGPRL